MQIPVRVLEVAAAQQRWAALVRDVPGRERVRFAERLPVQQHWDGW
jgi:hypothetical protein